MQQTVLIKPDVKGFYDSRTGSIQYVVSDPNTGRSAIIDPVLDFDEKSGATATRSADTILDFVHENGLTPQGAINAPLAGSQRHSRSLVSSVPPPAVNRVVPAEIFVMRNYRPTEFGE